MLACISNWILLPYGLMMFIIVMLCIFLYLVLHDYEELRKRNNTLRRIVDERE